MLLNLFIRQTLKLFSRKDGKGFPSKIKSLLDGPVFIKTLSDKALLEEITELHILMIEFRKLFFTDDGGKVPYFLNM